jgi:quercetin dioxygenase-like cupin family protein
MHKLSLLLAVFIAAGLAAAGAQRAGTQRIPQIENESVRVWKTILSPHQPLTMHRHEHARVLVALRGGTVRIVQQSGESRTLTWETGKAYWLPADPPGALHGDENVSEGPIEVVVVELLR